jgi:plasmid stabilization system protein ParE
VASQKRLKLSVVIAPAVVDEFHRIWSWTAGHFGDIQADAYLAFLKSRILRLARRYSTGMKVGHRPDLHCLIVRRRASGHGHVVVYRFDDKQVEVLHIFHSAQDWESKLAESLHDS